MPYKLMATIDGAQKEVDVVEIPEPVVQDIIKQRKLMPGDAFESELNRRTESVIKNKGLRSAAEYLDDASFVEQISQKHGLKKGDTSADVAQQIAQRVETERKSWEEKNLTPLQKQLQDATARERKLIETGLRKEILRAGGQAGLKKLYLREPVEGRTPLAVGIFEGLFRYDGTTGEYYVAKGEDGFEFSSKPTTQRPYMTVQEYIGNWAEQKENADFVESQHQGGPGLGTRSGTEGKQIAGSITLSAEQAQDGPTYQEALKRVGGDHSKIVVQGAGGGTNPFGSWSPA